MKNDILITVVIPFYNDCKFLNHAILSVLNQEYFDFKLLLLDDGSTDGSLAIAKSYIYDKRVEVISDGENKGLIFRLNQSIDIIDTKYYARMDADDIMHPHRLRIQVSILEANPSIDVLGTNAYSIDSDNTIKGVRKNISENIVDCKFFIHPSVMIKLSWLKSNKYLAEAKRIEDKELWVRTLHESVFKTVNLPLLYYREFGSNYWRKYYSSIKSHFSLYAFYQKHNRIKSKYWLKEALKTMAKTTIYKISSIFDMEDKLINRRCLSLQKSQYDIANEMLTISVTNTVNNEKNN